MLDSEAVDVILPEIKAAAAQGKTPAFIFDRVRLRRAASLIFCVCHFFKIQR
jgi:hypothetical protein